MKIKFKILCGKTLNKRGYNIFSLYFYNKKIGIKSEFLTSEKSEHLQDVYNKFFFSRKEFSLKEIKNVYNNGSFYDIGFFRSKLSNSLIELENKINQYNKKNFINNFKREKVIYKNKSKKALIYLKKAFDLNVDAHNYVEYSQEAYNDDNHGLAKFYSQKKWFKYQKKAFYIKKAIEIIKENKLSIKYGINKNEKIIYFHYNGDQISFHYVGNKAPTNKKYKGQWKGEKNFSFPWKI